MIDPSSLINIIEQNYAPLSAKCFEALISTMEIKSYEKGETIVKEGQYASKVYFIIQGSARAYYLHNGKDISDWFAFDNECISSIVSFFDGKPSPHYIEALDNSIIAEVSKNAIEQISDQFHDFERLIRNIVTDTMLKQRQRISSILFHTAEERYIQIESIHPGITHKVALKHIASYLGITMETLSRVRKSLAGN